MGSLFEKKIEIIAEAGLNHNGNFKNALKLVKITKEAKVDYVKFQLFKTEKFINKNFKHHKEIIKNLQNLNL